MDFNDDPSTMHDNTLIQENSNSVSNSMDENIFLIAEDASAAEIPFLTSPLEVEKRKISSISVKQSTQSCNATINEEDSNANWLMNFETPEKQGILEL